MNKVKVHFTFDGKRSSASIDRFMFEIYSIKCGSEGEARDRIRSAVSSGIGVGKINLSSQIQNMIFRSCCRPSLIDKHDNNEGQYDIEDF